MVDDGFAPLPAPPYWAVIFTARLRDPAPGYAAMAAEMAALAASQPGYLGAESTRGDNGLGITVSYWKDEESIRAWKEQADHLGAQKLGRERWYSHYVLRVARVGRAYAGPEGR
ncbi:MAG TPA: antibiotic biosynthesis monooxygenase [Aliiroseovarius sp.]|nr:antibiotic biosynthesis monooxygenase [Aliiroseovarius sp.]